MLLISLGYIRISNNVPFQREKPKGKAEVRAPGWEGALISECIFALLDFLIIVHTLLFRVISSAIDDSIMRKSDCHRCKVVL